MDVFLFSYKSFVSNPQGCSVSLGVDLLLLLWAWCLIAIPAAATQTQPGFCCSLFLHLIFQTNKHKIPPSCISMGSSSLPFPSGAGVSHFPSNTTFFILIPFDTTAGDILGRIQTQVLWIRKEKWERASTIFHCVLWIWQEFAKSCFPEHRRIKITRNKFLFYPLFENRLFCAVSAHIFLYF